MTTAQEAGIFEMMNWRDLLAADPLGAPRPAGESNRSLFERDHDRILFSAPFRRLANKTQVQPLSENDHVHHRLIHSLEVASVARSLGMRLGRWLIAQGQIAEGVQYDIAAIVQAAALAHDIGNPPFGHSGETSIGEWFSARFATGAPLFAQIPAGQRREFCKFEGNAQGFRILARLEKHRDQGGMQLSKATLGAFMKYPVTAAVSATLAGAKPVPISAKKFGVFESEATLFGEVAQGLGLPALTGVTGQTAFARHPLAFLVEAADDICYNLVDLEDDFATGGLPFQEVLALMCEISADGPQDAQALSQSEQLSRARSRAIAAAIDSVISAFVTHYAAIMQGTHHQALTECAAIAAPFATIKQVAKAQIFSAPRKIELEISGRKALHNVLDGLLPLYEELAAKGWDADDLTAHSAHLLRAFKPDLTGVACPYSALHSLADFVSGMTDRYALRLSRILAGI